MSSVKSFPSRWLMNRRSLAALVAAVAAAAFVVPLPIPAVEPSAPKASDDENPHLWKPQTRSVAVFKNGLGFFMREGDVKVREGWCLGDRIPPATFGTLAIYAMAEKETVDIVGCGPGEVVEFDDRDAPKDPAVKVARLEAAKNLQVQLHYTHKGQPRTAAGKLVSAGPQFAALETESNNFAVPVEGITRMQILGLPLRVHVAGTAEKQPERVKLGMAYLRKGITWLPDYTLKVLDDDTAELTLRGTLVNQAEDLIHTDVHLVVGVPHFMHTDYLAPIAVGQVIRTLGAAMASQAAPQGVTTQIMSRSAIVSNAQMAPQFEGAANVAERPVEAGGDLGDAFKNLPQIAAAAGTDYTVYTKKDLTLRQGEKAILTLFVKKIKYSHIYRWTPPGQMEHSLVLRNTTDTPWTTGPCLAISGEHPLTEDLLKYTPKAGNGELPVTAAVNIAHEKTERETDRKLKAHSPSHNVYFDLVTLEGKLTLRNFEKRSVDVVISNPVPGKPVTAEQGGAISIDATKLKLLEREGSIGWHVRLEPGEQKTLSYQYERYVPSN